MKTVIPTKNIGPIRVISSNTATIKDITVPLATFEKPLWLSVNRGATVTRISGGIKTIVVNDCMTRSILLQANDASSAVRFIADLKTKRAELEKIVMQSSKFARLKDWDEQIVADLIYLRFVFTTGDASGHNMATKAAELLQDYILREYAELKYISISGNYCADKKNSAVNGILGRGKYVIAECLIPNKICQEKLRSTPEKIVNLNIKKNLLGSIISGSVRTANAHFANMLLAIYLATGQDCANIIEGSQGFTYAEVRGGDLYFTVTLPNIIVGTVGAGKNLEFARENLECLGCFGSADSSNSQYFASIIAATVLCGELSLLAAQTNQGELMRCHEAIERH
jgi:hydroxymethylglutaryl-CoA reductase (NADPH)